MRLDHLLSKEFFALAVLGGWGRLVCSAGLKVGWWRVVSACLGRVWWEFFGRGRAWRVIGVLGQRALAWCALVGLAGLVATVLVVVGSGVGGLVVNCIVGASISAPRESLACGAMRLGGFVGRVFCFALVLFLFVCFVCCLFLWAFGGCLGIRGR